jgi:hypothetical protein
VSYVVAKNEVLFLFAATTKAALRYISTYKYGQSFSRPLVQGGGGQAHLQVILKGLFHETLLFSLNSRKKKNLAGSFSRIVQNIPPRNIFFTKILSPHKNHYGKLIVFSRCRNIKVAILLDKTNGILPWEIKCGKDLK